MERHGQQDLVLRLPEHVTGEEEELAHSLLSAECETSIVLTGAAGSGKTTTLLALAARADIQKRFREGVYLLRLGQSTTASEVAESLLEVAEGLRMRRTLARSENLLFNPEKLVDGLSVLTAGLGSRPILLLIDDVEMNSVSGECVRQIVKELARNVAAKLRVVITTNDLATAESLQIRRRFPIEMSSVRCVEMLCNYAEVDRATVREDELDIGSVFRRVLDKCDGLPLNLMLVGRGIRGLKENDDPHATGDLWTTYLKKLSTVSGTGGRNRSSVGWLWATVSLNASLVENRLPDLSLHDLFRSMCVLPSNRSIPLTTLACLWDVKVSEAEKAAVIFARMGIVAIERLDSLCIRIHHVVHDACSKEALKRGKTYVKDTHGRLVDNYYKLLSNSSDDSERQWWRPMEGFNLDEDDGYLTENLIRHLSYSGRIRETLSVLLNFLWTETRVIRSRKARSLAGIPVDIKTYLASLPNFTAVDYSATSETIEEIREGLGFLAEAAKRAAPIIATKPSELAFQLYGRLARRRERSPVVKAYLWSMDLRAEALRRQERGVVDF